MRFSKMINFFFPANLYIVDQSNKTSGVVAATLRAPVKVRPVNEPTHSTARSTKLDPSSCPTLFKLAHYC